MLTAKIIQSEIDDLLAKGSVMRQMNEEDGREYKAMQRRIKFLKSCLFYLQENPREEFITQQLEKLKKKLYRIMNGFTDWKKYQQTTKDKTHSQWQSQYNSEMGTTQVNNQIKTLEFILS